MNGAIGFFLPLLLLQPPPPENLLLHLRPRATAAQGDPGVITDGVISVEGEIADSGTLLLGGPRSGVLLDLGRTRPVAALLLQGESEGSYHVFSSVDGHAWEEMANAPPSADGPGLRARFGTFDPPRMTRYLRISATGGSGRYALSEVQAFSTVPVPWPPPPPPPPPSRTLTTVGPAASPTPLPPVQPAAPAPAPRTLTDDDFVAVKAALAGLAFLACLAGLKRSLRKPSEIALAVLAVLSFAAWWNFGWFHIPRFAHSWDSYHYVVGGKYFPELRYVDLYACTAAADAEDGLEAQVLSRKIRDLRTNHLESGARVLEDGAACRSRFSAARWAAFKEDVAFFRNGVSPATWAAIQQDHGFNGTPVWTIGGRLIAEAFPLSTAPIVFLAAIDSFLLVAMWGIVFQVFGWRAAAVALVFWGCNYPARYWWTGGAFLRMDWLFLAAIGVSLLKKKRPLAAGFCFGWSALLRIFPGVILLGILLQIAARSARQRKLAVSPDDRRVFSGAALACAILLPASVAVSGRTFTEGLAAWPEFLAKSRIHLATPLTNHVGLATLAAFDPATRAQVMVRPASDPFEAWKDVRRRAEERARPYLTAAAVLASLFFARAVREREPWVAAAASLVLVPVFVPLTSYYAVFFLIPALLALEVPRLGAPYCLAACLSCVAGRVWLWDDQRYAAVSLILLALGIVTLVFLARRTPAPLLASRA